MSLRLLIAVALALPVLAQEQRRVPWTSGKVTGMPGTPPPFELRRVFPKLKFDRPLEIIFMPGGRVIVAEQAGRVVSFPNEKDVAKTDLFFDLKTAITDWKNVPGAKGTESVYAVEFHPKFKENKYVFICYTLYFPKRTTEAVGSRISRFNVVMDGEVPRVDVKSEKKIIEWQQGGHNGCAIKFGPDGMLYISTGDQADPFPPDMYETGQDVSDLRSAILRIDVDREEGGKAYAIPRDNPFVRLAGARGEVWSYGYRNPWRMSFDREVGGLWVADVGWELYEMVYCVKSGLNAGWSVMEGPNPIKPNAKRGPTPISPPQLALTHAEAMSITGGFVYRGKKFPKLVGHYVFGDWDTRRMWAAKLTAPDKCEPHQVIAITDQRVVSFGEDADGELYVVDYEGGGLYELAANPVAGTPSNFPMTLSATGIFSNVAKQTPAAGVTPYAIKARQWMDGATARHLVAVPEEKVVGWTTNDVFSRLYAGFPRDSVLLRTFSLPMKTGDPSSAKNVESQLLHFDGHSWQGYSYRWREDGSDADLVEEGGADMPLTIEDASMPEGKRKQTWHFNSRTQCMTCHGIHAGYLIAYNEPQLDLTIEGEKQVEKLRKMGLLSPPYKVPGGPQPPGKFALVDPADESAPLDERARSYLHANCAHCHRENGGGSAAIDLRKELPLNRTRAVDKPPVLGAFGIEDARVIAPGEPGRSVMLYRIAKTGSGRMPHIGSDVVDARGVALVGKWIESQSPGKVRRDVAGVSTTGEALTAVYLMETGSVAREPLVKAAMKSPSPAVRDLFERFTGRDTARTPKLGVNIDRVKLLAMTGDPARGREVFVSVAQCASCHAAGDVPGREFGPSLSKIAAKYEKAGLLEQILEPSKTITEGFQSYTIHKTDGDALSGFLVSRDEKEIVIKDAALETVRMPMVEVRSVSPQRMSTMPAGLLAPLDAQQAADLLAWLGTLK